MQPALFQLCCIRVDQPPLQIVHYDVCQCMYPIVALIQAGDVTVFAASRMQEIFLAFQCDLFQRFQAVGHETGTDYIYTPGFLCSPGFQGGGSIGLEPFCLAEAGLETDGVLLRLQSQFLG